LCQRNADLLQESDNDGVTASRRLRQATPRPRKRHTALGIALEERLAFQPRERSKHGDMTHSECPRQIRRTNRQSFFPEFQDQLGVILGHFSGVVLADALKAIDGTAR
jgi:hypothetical protein